MYSPAQNQNKTDRLNGKSAEISKMANMNIKEIKVESNHKFINPSDHLRIIE